MSQNYIITNGELHHWGIKGMKWGRRRYQNPDGSLTDAGKKRYSKLEAKDAKKAAKAEQKAYDKRERNIAANWYEAYNKAVYEVNHTILPELNEKYKGYNFNDRATNAEIKKVYERYVEEYSASWNKLYETKVNELFGASSRGTQAKDLWGYYTPEDIEYMKND